MARCRENIYLFPPGDTLGMRLPAHEIPDAAPAPLRERGAKSGRTGGPLLSGDATVQVDEDCLLPLLRYPLAETAGVALETV